MHRVLILLVVVLMTCVLSSNVWALDSQETICDQSYVIFCDNFEARSVGGAQTQPATYKNGGWDGSNSTACRIASDAAGVYAGSRSFDVYYTAGSGTGPGYCVGLFASNAPEVYARWYAKYSSNFVFSYSTKGNYLFNADQNQSNIWFERLFGDDGVYINSQQDPNIWHTFSQTLANDTWYCLEVRDKRSSSTSAPDAILTAWVNGVQVGHITGLVVDNVSSSPASRAIGAIMIAGQWNNDGSPSSHPEQHRWVDNIVIGTQRIGCNITGGGGDTTPPAAPSGLYISAQ